MYHAIASTDFRIDGHSASGRGAARVKTERVFIIIILIDIISITLIHHKRIHDTNSVYRTNSTHPHTTNDHVYA